jgi:hypothetical protein
MLLPEQQLWPLLALVEDHLVDHHKPDLAYRLQEQSSTALHAVGQCKVATSRRMPKGRIMARLAQAAAMAVERTSTIFNRIHRELSLPSLGTGAATAERLAIAAGMRSTRDARWRRTRVSPESLVRSDAGAWGVCDVVFKISPTDETFSNKA